MNEPTIIFTMSQGVATITLNRPEARNALTPDMLCAFSDALDDCEATGIRAVVIKGSGGAFCSGADIKDFVQGLQRGPSELSSHLKDLANQLHRDVILKIRQLPKPVVGSINGVAAGAGFSLALACDLRIAAQDARFFMAYSNIGATADGGSTYYLPKLVGIGRTMEIYTMSQPMDAERASQLGLVNWVVETGELETQTIQTAQRLASGPTVAYGRVKAMLDNSWSSGLVEQLDNETKAISEIAWTNDFHEGITAFVEKRTARFQGN